MQIILFPLQQIRLTAIDRFSLAENVTASGTHNTILDDGKFADNRQYAQIMAKM